MKLVEWLGILEGLALTGQGTGADRSGAAPIIAVSSVRGSIGPCSPWVEWRMMTEPLGTL
eukprot:732203-Pleurochrysis_carterae.AAC.3